MIVGSVELLATASTSGFYESLIKGTTPAADKAGNEAGRVFGAAFVKSAPPLASALIRNGEAFVATAESQGQASGQAFSRAYIAGLEKAGVATGAMFRDPAVVAGAETEGASAGRAFAAGVQGQLPLFGEEGLTAGRAFSRSFIEGTASTEAGAAQQGAAAGRAFVSGDLEQLRLGQTQIVAAIREQGAAIVTSQEETGAAAGAAFARGQRRGIAAGTTESSALSFGRLGQGAEAAGLGAGARFAGAMQKGVAIGTIAAVAATAWMAGQFQQKTNILVTAAGEDVHALGLVRKGILDIATSTGTKWQDLTDGMYQIEKAGYRGADGLRILRAAAQAAREEGANLATVTNATTSVMASYHLGVDQAVGVTNAIKTAAGESKTTMEQFAGSLSTVLPIASANHIAFADVAGALATLTQHGTSADEATQELSNTIRNLAAPNQVASKEMAQLGINSNDVSQALGTRGLTGTLDFLSRTVLEKMGPSGLLLLDTFNKSKIAAQAAQTEFGAMSPAAQKLAQSFKDGTTSVAGYRKEARALPGEQGVLAMQFFQTYSNAMGFQNALKQGGPAAQTYSAAIKAMTGGANGLNTTLQITGESLDGTVDRTKRISDAMNAGGKDVQGWASTQKLFNVQMDIAKEKLSAAAITIGTVFLPILGGAAKLLGGAFSAIADGAERAGKFLGPLFHDLGTQLSEFGRIVKPAFDAFRDSPLFKPAILIALGAIVAPILLLGGALKLLTLAFRDIVNPVARFVAQLVRDVPGALNAVGRFFSRMYSDVTGFASRIWSDVSGFFSRMWRDVTGFTSRIWRDVSGFFARIYHDVTGAVSATLDFIGRHWRLLIVIFTGPVGFVIDLIYKFRSQIGAAFSFIASFVVGQMRWAWGVVTGLFSISAGFVIGVVRFLWNTTVALFKISAGFVIGVVAFLWNTTVSLFKISAGFVLGILRGMWTLTVDLFKISTAFVIGIFTGFWHILEGMAVTIWHAVEAPFQHMWAGLKIGFEDAVGAIEATWHRLGEIFRVPINFLINTVYDGGIVPVWNFVAGVIGEDSWKLHKVDPIKPFEKGGGTSGPWRGDDRYIKIGGNEHVLESPVVDALGGHQAVAAIRSQALGGKPVRVMGDGPGTGYWAGGGGWTPDRVLHDVTHNPVTDTVGGAAKAVVHGAEDVAGWMAHAVRGALADSAAPALNGILGLFEKLLPKGGGQVGQFADKSAHKLIDGVINWIRGQDARDQATAGGQPISWDGGSNTIGLIEKLGRALPFGNRMTITSTHRNGGGRSYHDRDEAVDWSNGTGNTPEMLAFDRAWAQTYGSSLAELIYTAPGSVFIKDGNIVGPGLYSSVLDEHRNHVHVAISPQSIARGHQRFMPFGNTGGPAGDLQGYAQSLLNKHGWGSQFGLLDYIIKNESNWNVHAANPSGAYGIPQALPGSKMASAGPDWRDSGATQLRWMIDQYIPQRYHSLQAAYDYKRRTGVYDDGGLWMPGTAGVNLSGRVERVLDPDETVAYEAGQRSVGSRGTKLPPITQTNHYHGVDVPTAHTLAGRALTLALTKAGVTP